MASIPRDTVLEWAGRCEAWVKSRGYTMPLASIKKGVDAWSIAHGAGIVNEAYKISPKIHDAHIQTALQVIFPNVVFRDKKRY